MIKPVHTVLAAALALATLPAFAQSNDQPYSQTVFFGDSLTDSGFYRPALVETFGPSAAIGGRFTTNPGLVWSEYLADFYGTSATPGWQITADGTILPGAGTNFAAGGARVDTGPGFPPITTPVPVAFAPSVSAQIDAYLARSGGQADPNALYSVWGGANDLFFLLESMDPATTLPLPLRTTPAQFLGTAAAQAGLIARLDAAGARYIMVATMPDVGRVPFGLASGPFGATLTNLAENYNATLFGGIQQAGLRVIPLDIFHLFQELAVEPSRYGFGPITAAGGACGDLYALFCTPNQYVSPDSANSAFADEAHPSTRAHEVIAQYAAAILEGPRQIAVLPNSASMTGRARADRVAAQLAVKPEADGMRWWGDARGDFQRYDHGDHYDGAGPAFTLGVDWARGNLVFGAFGGYGQQQADFGHRSGSFDQSDATLGGFVGWSGGGAWVNAQASYSQLDFDIDRDVQLGQASRTHRGETDGDNLSVGANGGWEFGDGAFRHGPVLGVLAQKIEIDGFAESDPTLSTSLAYSDQSHDSLIGSAGWQLSYQIHEHLTPYARLTIDREFEDAPAEAFAQLQAMPGTAPYAVPGAQFDHRYSTLLFGARTQMFGLDANLGTSLTIEQGGGNHATVFATVGGSF